MAEPEDIFNLFSKKFPNQRWSPSLQWMHELLAQVIDAIANDLIFPSLRHDGLRWKANWTLLNDNLLKDRRKQLYIAMPEVIGFKSEIELQEFQNLLTAVTCRQAFQYTNWSRDEPNNYMGHEDRVMIRVELKFQTPHAIDATSSP